MEKESYYTRTRKLVENARGLTNGQLREMFSELGVGRLRGVSEFEKTWGEEVMYSDVLMILGAERGLWDEAGYPKEPSERKFDKNFSRACEDKIHEMWYESNFPLLVFLILDLKFGIRRIDDRTLLELSRMADAPWLFQVPETNELLEWRLATLRLAIRAVLFDRGYSEDQIQSSYV